MKRDIEALLDEVVTLPSLPNTVATILGMLNDPECAMTEVGHVISADPALAMKALRLANSPYYGIRHKTTSVEHAVVLLGAQVLKNLVLTASVLETLQGSLTKVLRHSVACAVAMRTLVESKACPPLRITADEAFVLGLLHDIGKVIFEQFLPVEFKEAVTQVQSGRVLSCVAERDAVGVDHPDMGGRLARHWRLPESVADAIHGHHDLARCPDAASRTSAAALSVADYVVTVCGMPAHSESDVEVPEEAWETLQLASESAGAFMNAFFDAFSSVEEFIQLAA